MQLLAMAHSTYRIDADKRQWCLRQWWLMDTKAQGANGVSGNDPAAIERRYGPAFDARLQRFKGIRRFALRPTFQALGDVTYRADRGVLEGFIPMPQVSAAGQSVTGKGFVPWVHRTSTGAAHPTPAASTCWSEWTPKRPPISHDKVAATETIWWCSPSTGSGWRARCRRWT